ncbi:DNA polymerase [Bradyrhizobium stylosanthis]|uniref:DNA-directed DNA polymerase n=1 Tax=Bradyrhizobium stylosanthis TaxID=1803665 RepID=A0A560CXF7_9BRAD|nr:DNA polymerase [Bradyrhizobium stylosanthis]TWA89535.1 DNA polymerase [Bradyrhizobium stylosanthis]
MSNSVLTIDFETRSPVDLKKTGVYPYAENADTDVWCAAWAIDAEPIQVWGRGDPVPERLAAHVRAGSIIAAWNANFEIAIWTYIMGPRYGWPMPKMEQWRCSMVAAYAMSLPGALDNAAGAIGLDIGKDQAGKRLMLAMSKPRRPKKGEPTEALLWREDPKDIEVLRSYCRTDVEVERGIRARLVALRPFEQSLWHLDQRVNSRGVFVDVELAQRSLKIVEHQERQLDREMAKLTDYEVSACTNLNQLKVWLKGRGVTLGARLDKKTMAIVDTLDKTFVEEMLARDHLDPPVRRALELRQEAGKASVAKIDAILNGMSADGRARGLLQFNAANTGRWAGRRFQPQNLKRPPEDFDCDGAIEVILKYPTQKAIDTLDAMYDAPMSCLSYILRGLIKAPAGKKIVAADFSNIEGRVLAWLAGARKKLDAFRAYDRGEGPDLYKVMAGMILRKRPEDVTKDERQVRGKVPELACGFGGGVGAFQTMAHTYNVKIDDDEADEIKKAWRQENPEIVQFWYDCENAAIKAISKPGHVFTAGPLAYKVVGSFLWCRLPSGRALCFPYPKIYPVKTPWGETKDAVTFKTVPNVSNSRKIVWADESNTSRWARISTYGGDLAQGPTQAVARDFLAEAMVRLERHNYPIILTCHDENVSEADADFGSASEYEEIMCELPSWGGGIPIAASGFESSRYRK